MDDYTKQTKHWLDQRFKATNADGVYRGHQPIYGFREEPCEPASIRSYTITYHILNALAELDFRTLLDVGGAEGYKAALVREIFNADVVTADLSKEACRRAHDLYGIPACPIDVHALPFASEQFDVVLCSETLEHVKDFELAVRELLRVAREAVVVTVPHESVETVEENIRRNVPHGHIHALDVTSMDFLRADVQHISARKILSPWLRVPIVLADARPPRARADAPWLARWYGKTCPALRLLFGRRTAAALIRADAASQRLPGYGGILFILRKNGERGAKAARYSVAPERILDFAVEPLYLGPEPGRTRETTRKAVGGKPAHTV